MSLNALIPTVPTSTVSDRSSTGTSAWRCRVCADDGPFERHEAREHMFGLGECFEYRMCGACGCLQIAELPTDLGRYYGPGYYSMGARPHHGRVAAALIRARNRHLAGRFDPLGAWLARRRPFLALASLRLLRPKTDARIVDVGCGGGELLQALQSAGFAHLRGVDPFVPHDLNLGGGLTVKRTELADLATHPAWFASADLVMFHHSLEHIADTAAALRAAHAVLVSGGYCVVRIPTVSSYAWRHYGVDWCALDAPRHLMLHSRRSIALLAERCGFEVRGIADDSTAFQFWGSEQYRRGVALMRAGCHDIVPAPGQFSDNTLRDFARRAAALNRLHDGDQIIVYLRRGA